MSIKAVWDYMLLDEYGYLKPLNQQHLPVYAWPGGYTITYYTNGGSLLCADCATKALYRLDDEFDPPTAYDVYWEGPITHCEDCGKPIESSYGDPDEGDDDAHDPTDNDDNENYRPSGFG